MHLAFGYGGVCQQKPLRRLQMGPDPDVTDCNVLIYAGAYVRDASECGSMGIGISK